VQAERALARVIDPAARQETAPEARGEYPDVPEHYLAFLQHVGHGALGDSGFDTRNKWQMVGVDSGWPKPHPQRARTAEFVAELLEREKQSPDGL
jgi:hypothetical protein